MVVDDQKIHLILELAQGGELFNQIEARGKLPEEEARQYFTQLIAAMDYCHSMSVCHRDLKLENVLLEGVRPTATCFECRQRGVV